MSFLLIICVTLVSLLSVNFSPAAFQSDFIYGNETDRLALLKLKSKLTYYYNPHGALDSSDHCSWVGVKCNLKHPRRVTVLDLSHPELGLSFEESIPPDIGNLTFLTTLRLSHNGLYGEIPQEIGRLYRLRYLDLSDNQLSGEIPSSLKNCLELRGLYLNDNMFEGVIPPSLQSLKGIQELDLSSNLFSGPIPEYLDSFLSLKKLDFSDNNMSGEIPQGIGHSFRLQFLDLSDNYFSGEIPSSLGNCIHLKGLYLSGNYFEGIIPPSFRSLKGIQELTLDGNSLSGQIPEYLESFHSLKKLNLSWNNFEGEVPKQGIFKNTSAFFYHGRNLELCGGNRLLQLPSCPGIISEKLIKQSPIKRRLLILISSGVVICAVILGVLIKFLWRTKARIQASSSESPFSYMFHKVSYNEILTATDGFSAKNLLGVGGYGSVYVGILMLSQEITSVVAVKVLDLQRRGALKSFKAECEASRCIRHRNIMKILTSCASVDFMGNEFKALVYEYMPNGSLENWLHPTANYGRLQRSINRPLKFIERLNIAIDVASALDYLHQQCETPIAHCDLKPSNVLLDEDMNGHLGDFGSAKFLLGDGFIINAESGNHCSSSLIRGSIGYVAPEYGMGRTVSTYGDFYSFGIMLLELFTGRRPTADMFKDGLTLHSFAKTALTTDKVMEIVDPTTFVVLQNDEENVIVNGEKKDRLCDALTVIFKLGVTCSIETPKERMEMELVVKALQSVKNIYIS